MLPYNELPVILVSAVDTATAASFISELIDNEVRDIKADSEGVVDRVWRMTNKYYTAEVRLHPIGDSDSENGALALACVEAHVVYLTEEEGEREAHARWTRAQHAGVASSVSVVAGAWPRAPPAIDRWAAAHRVEAVPLHDYGPPTSEGEGGAPFRESYGLQRVRDGLHAYAWRGLRRHRPGTGEVRSTPSEEEGAVERAEAFALALGALNAVRDPSAAADDALRRQRAEDVVAAFAHALGIDLHDS